MKPGKGAAFVRTKLKNLLNGSNQEKTFRGGETVNMADVSRREGQFTYAEGDEVSWAGQGSPQVSLPGPCSSMQGDDQQLLQMAAQCCPFQEQQSSASILILAAVWVLFSSVPPIL